MEFLEFLGVILGFPFIDFQPLKTSHSLQLGIYMTTPGGATFISMRPARLRNVPLYRYRRTVHGYH